MFLNVIDEHSRLYRATAYIRSDNGPEFIAQALRDWCEASDNTSTVYIVPGSLWENDFLNRMSSARRRLQRAVPG